MKDVQTFKHRIEKQTPCGCLLFYEMEDWMKRSYCLLQDLRYPPIVNKVVGKMLKKI